MSDASTRPPLLAFAVPVEPADWWLVPAFGDPLSRGLSYHLDSAADVISIIIEFVVCVVVCQTNGKLNFYWICSRVFSIAWLAALFPPNICLILFLFVLFDSFYGLCYYHTLIGLWFVCCWSIYLTFLRRFLLISLGELLAPDHNYSVVCAVVVDSFLFFSLFTFSHPF